jgi:hypothetical protein
VEPTWPESADVELAGPESADADFDLEFDLEFVPESMESESESDSDIQM